MVQMTHDIPVVSGNALMAEMFVLALSWLGRNASNNIVKITGDD